ncbi:MAG: nucleoside-diphosphate kinase [Calditrichaeota bacterium]|nr:MAG: nucleoside-diphosphate kinase [Calditrichota bacterium]
MLEQTLTIIKPECVENKHIGEVISRIEKAGYRIRGMKMLTLSRRDAEIFYQVHRERPFYGELTEYMSSGPVVVMVLEKENCIADFRRFIGATNPAEAEQGTIRADFGMDIQRNCVHASDSPENAVREIRFFFAQRELV